MSGISDEERDVFTFMFQKVDLDLAEGEGRLNSEQLYLLLILCGYRFSRELVQVNFQYTDSDWRISLEEYLSVLDSMAPTGSFDAIAADLRRQFRAADLNTDLTGDMIEDLLEDLTKDMHVTYGDLQQTMGSDFDVPNDVTDWDEQVNFEEYVQAYAKSKVKVDDDDVQEDAPTVTPMSEEVSGLCPQQDGDADQQDDGIQRQAGEEGHDDQEQHEDVEKYEENIETNDEIAEVEDDSPEIQIGNEDTNVQPNASSQEEARRHENDAQSKVGHKGTAVSSIADSWGSRSEGSASKRRTGSSSSPDSECSGISVKNLASRYQKMTTST